MSGVDFSAIEQSVLSDPAASPVTAATPSPSLDPTSSGTVTPAPSGAKVVTAADDDLVEVVVNGETKQIPWKEARSGVMFQADYTRKTQEHANRVKEYNAAVEEYNRRFAELEAAQKALEGNKVTPTAEQKVGPDDLLTAGQFEKELSLREAKIKAENEKVLRETLGKLEAERTFQRWDEKSNELIETLVEKLPELKVYGDHAARILKLDARQFSPTDEKGMLDSIKKSAKLHSDKLKKDREDFMKAEAVRKAELAKKGPIPPGGHIPPPPARNFNKGRAIDFKAIENAIREDGLDI